MYEAECEGETAFIITLEDEEKTRLARQVVQPDLEVGQPRPENAADSRLAALKAEIRELESLRKTFMRKRIFFELCGQMRTSMLRAISTRCNASATARWCSRPVG